MQRKIFNIQLTKEEIMQIIRVLEGSIGFDESNDYFPQQSEVYLKQYFEDILEQEFKS